MAVKNPDQRLGVFVDVSNMYYSAKNLYNGAKVDFGKVLQESIAGRKLIRAIAYVIKADIKEEQSFFDALERAGYEVKSKDLQIFAGGAKKGDWDVGITVDAIKLADKLDTVILVSGDGDYEPLVNYLQENKGCYVEAYAFGRTASSKLIDKVNEFHDLDENSQDHLIQPRRHTQQTVKAPSGTSPTGPIVQPEPKNQAPKTQRKTNSRASKQAASRPTPAPDTGSEDGVAPFPLPPKPTFFSTAVAQREDEEEKS